MPPPPHTGEGMRYIPSIWCNSKIQNHFWINGYKKFEISGNCRIWIWIRYGLRSIFFALYAQILKKSAKHILYKVRQLNCNPLPNRVRTISFLYGVVTPCVPRLLPDPVQSCRIWLFTNHIWKTTFFFVKCKAIWILIFSCLELLINVENIPGCLSHHGRSGMVGTSKSKKGYPTRIISGTMLGFQRNSWICRC